MKNKSLVLTCVLCLVSCKLVAAEPPNVVHENIDFIHLPFQSFLLPGRQPGTGQGYILVERFRVTERRTDDSVFRMATLTDTLRLSRFKSSEERPDLNAWLSTTRPEMSISTAVGCCMIEDDKNAEALLRKVHAFCSRTFDEEHLAYAASLHNLGVVLKMQRRFDESQKYLQESISLLEKYFSKASFPRGHYCLIHAIGEMGGLLAMQGEYAEAIDYHEKALEMYRLRSGDSSLPFVKPYCGLLLEALELLYVVRDQQARQSATPLSSEDRRTELEVKSAALSARAFTLNDGNHDLATMNYQAALEMLNQLYPQEKYRNGHKDISTCMANMADAFKVQKEYRWAQVCFERSLEMHQALNPSSKDANSLRSEARMCTNLADVLVKQQKYAEATTRYTQAHAANKSLYPADRYPNGHIALIESLNNLSYSMRMSGDYVAASKFGTEALACCKRFYRRAAPSAGDLPWIEALANRAARLQAQNQYPLARKAYDSAAAVLDPSRKKKPPSLLGVTRPSRAESMLKRLRDEFEFYDKCIAAGITREAKKGFPRGAIDYPTLLDLAAFKFSQEGDLDEAIRLQRKALATLREYFPPKLYPVSHQRVATAQHKLARYLSDKSDFEQARLLLEEAMEMRQQLYPVKEFPQGHPEIAESWEAIGDLSHQLGDYERAKECYEKSLAMRRQLYPRSQHPNGHNELIKSFCNLGTVFLRRGDFIEAAGHYAAAAKMWTDLYPDGKAPNAGDDSPPPDGKRGHDILSKQATVESLVARISTGMGRVMRQMGKLSQAESHFELASKIQQRRYPKVLYPDGHPEVARALLDLGATQTSLEKHPDASDNLLKSMKIWETVYPAEDFPQGNSELASCLNALGIVSLLKGQFSQAVETFEREAKMRLNLAMTVFDGVSEAEALNFAAAHLAPPNELISVWQQSGKSDQELYFYVWKRRGKIHQTLASRRRLLNATNTPQVRSAYQQYEEIRRTIAQKALAGDGSGRASSTSHVAKLASLSRQKERLERFLASQLPEFRRRLESQRSSPPELVERLARNVVFVDMLRYSQLNVPDDGSVDWDNLWKPNYVAFLLSAGNSVRRVDLGPAAPIETAVSSWRDDIVNARESVSAAKLRRLLWKPIAEQLPASVDTVFICPDAALTAVPWAALPGQKSDTVLLEELAIAIVPHGQFLLDQLTRPAESDSQYKRVLAVGDVDYDTQLSSSLALAPATASHDVVRGDNPLRWPRLSATKQELAGLGASAGFRRVSVLSGANASTARVLSELPHVHWAHFATHGFFADARFRSALRLDPRLFEQSGMMASGERVTVAGRNPLLLSGLVLAGANSPHSKEASEHAAIDRGILTAEAIASMPLDDLEMAVLSACETGLGDVAGGEGVFGLQRAFHQAGARNVVASLWKVDDNATAALMRLFYHKHWIEGQSPLEALRQAQLTILRNPAIIKTLAESRGPDFTKKLRLIDSAKPDSVSQRAATKLWAGFVLSGLGLHSQGLHFEPADLDIKKSAEAKNRKFTVTHTTYTRSGMRQDRFNSSN